MRTTMMTNQAAGLTHMRVLLGAALLMLLAAVAPRALSAETAAGLQECVDGEWADYNDCLMESGMEWQRKLCDYYFEAGFLLCAAKFSGEVRKATSGTS